MPPMSGEVGKIHINWNDRNRNHDIRDWTIENGELTGAVDLPSNGWHDTYGGFQVWLSETSINRCSNLVPTGAVASENNNQTASTIGSESSTDYNSDSTEPADSTNNTQMQTQTSDQTNNNTEAVASPVPADTEPTSSGGGALPIGFLLLAGLIRRRKTLYKKADSMLKI